MPPKKRPAAASSTDNSTDPVAKKYKSAMDEMADEWICPITTELPIDPVMAEDEHIYERAAIEEHMRRQGNALKSPITKARMGPQLMFNQQALNTIEKLVKSGVIVGDKAESWTLRLINEEETQAMRKRVDRGDGQAMYQLGNWYFTGEKGLTKDAEAACRR